MGRIYNDQNKKTKTEEPSLLSKAGNFIKETGKEILRSNLQTATRLGTTALKTQVPVIGDQIVKRIPNTINTPVGEVNTGSKVLSGQMTKSDILPEIGRTGEDILNVATAGMVSGIGKQVVKAGVKQAVKEAVEQAAKKSAKEIAQTAAKVALKDAMIGGGYGLTSSLQQKDVTAKDVAVSTGIGALAGMTIPPVLGGSLKVTGKISKIAGEKLAAGIEETAGKLERYATKDESTVPKIRYRQAADKVNQTVSEKVAETGAKALRWINDTPQMMKRSWVDKYEAIDRFKKKADAFLGRDVGDLLDDVQRTQYRGGNIAENKLGYYTNNIVKKYEDDWKNVKEYAHYLDDLDRIANGNAVTGDKTLADVLAAKDAFEKAMTPAQLARVKQGQKELNDFLATELQDAVNSGRISQTDLAAIRSKHENYLPHDVLDYLDEENPAGKQLGKSFNVAKSGLEKTKGGSTKEIDDIDYAITRRLFRQSLLNEKNNTMSKIIEVGKEMGEKGGFVPLRTAEKVTARNQAIEELRKLRDEADRIKASLSSSNKQDRKLVTKLNQLDKEIDDLSQKAIDTFTSEEPDQFEKAVQVLVTRTDERATINATAKAEQETKIKQAILDNQKKERKTVLNRDIKAKEKELVDAEESYNNEIIKNLEDGKKPSPRIIKAYEKKQNDLLTALMEKDMILSEAIEPSKIKIPEPKITIKEKTIGPTPKQAIEQTIKDKNNEIEKLKNRIDLRERRLAETESKKAVSENNLDMLYDNFKAKKDQMKAVFEDVKANKDIAAKAADYQKQGFEKVSYFNNGIREDWLVPKDIGTALKFLDPSGAGAVMTFLNNSIVGKIITGPANVVRKISTTLSPVFALFSNPLRDIQTVSITAKALPEDYAKGLISTLSGHKMLDTELGNFYKFAKAEGALQGNIFREDRIAENIFRKKIEPTGLLGKAANIVGTIERGGETFEEMTRLAVFRRALIDGATPQEAAKMARNATVDFGKSGSWGQVANKVIPFLNARIQGLNNIATAVSKDPTKFVRKAMWTAAYPAVVLGAHNNRFSSYVNIPDDEKRRNWIIMVGQSEGRDYSNKRIMVPHYIKIPKGEAQQAISNLTERALNYGKIKYPDTTIQFMSKIIGDTSPITGASILPPGLSQFVEIKSNYSMFRDKQIVPDYVKVAGKWEESSQIEPKYQYTANTSEFAKALGMALNWSPTKIDYVIKIGVINDVIRTFDLFGRGTEKTAPFERAAELPFVRSILGSSSYGQAQQKKNFESRQLQEKKSKAIERRIKIQERIKANLQQKQQ